MDWGLLILALILVESGGDNSAVGDRGHAIGCLQIHRCVVEDVNRIYKMNFRYPRDALNRQKSVEICMLYLKHYGLDYERRTKKPATAEVLARIWNGGPNGAKPQAAPTR